MEFNLLFLVLSWFLRIRNKNFFLIRFDSMGVSYAFSILSMLMISVFSVSLSSSVLPCGLSLVLSFCIVDTWRIWKCFICGLYLAKFFFDVLMYCFCSFDFVCSNIENDLNVVTASNFLICSDSCCFYFYNYHGIYWINNYNNGLFLE